MIEVQARTREWGNSIGVTLPKAEMEKEGIGVNEDITLLIMKKDNTFKETFGMVKWKKSTQQIKDELRRELYHD